MTDITGANSDLDAAIAELHLTDVFKKYGVGSKYDATHTGLAEGKIKAAQSKLIVAPPPPVTSTNWAWDARNAPLDPNSPTLMATFLTYAVKSPNVALTNWAVATADAKASDPSYSIPLLKQGGSMTVQIALGTKPDPSGDGHLSVRNVETGIEIDLWQAVYDSTTQRIKSASSGIKFPLDAVNEQTLGWSGDAASTPLRRGLITSEAIKAGIITETMQFSTPQIGPGTPRYPAMHNAPTGPVGHCVEGTWFRLNLAIDVTALGLKPWEVTIAKALQAHGMILRDNGGTMSLYGENRVNRPGGNQAWADAGLSGSSVAFSPSFPWNKLEVLNPPPVS